VVPTAINIAKQSETANQPEACGAPLASVLFSVNSARGGLKCRVEIGIGLALAVSLYQIIESDSVLCDGQFGRRA